MHGPPKLVEEGTEFEFILVSPQCPADQRWNVERLDKLVTQLTRQYQIDKDRMYLTGLSMGGFGTWNYAIEHPEKWAAIVPICGGGDPEKAHRIAHIPAMIYHGAEDEVVPPVRSQEMYDAMIDAGAEKVSLLIYDGVGHNSWERTYKNMTLYDWLLNQSK
jgi:predicted peptidase